MKGENKSSYRYTDTFIAERIHKPGADRQSPGNHRRGVTGVTGEHEAALKKKIEG